MPVYMAPILTDLFISIFICINFLTSLEMTFKNALKIVFKIQLNLFGKKSYESLF